MDLIVYLACWYVFVVGVILIERVWQRWKSRTYTRPSPSVLTLKEGETIIGVMDRTFSLRFHIATDVVDGKNYE